MSIRTALAHALSALGRRVAPAERRQEMAVVERVLDDLKYRDPTWTLAKLKLDGSVLSRPYQQHGVIYSCMSVISEAACDIPIRIFRGKDEEDREEVIDEPIARLFERPNTYWSKAHWISAAIVQLLRDGNAIFVWDRENERQEPRSFYVYGREGWEPFFKKESRELTHWEWEIKRDGVPTKKRMEVFQATPIMTYNPHHEFWGMGPMQVAQLTAEHDFMGQKLTDAWYRNSGQPGGVISFTRPLTPEQIQKYKDQFNASHAGSLDKWFQTLVLEGAATYTPIPLNYQQMQFIEQRRYSAIEIAGIFHVPPVLISILDETHKATAKESYKEFYSKAVLPLCRLISDGLNAQFFTPWNQTYNDTLACEWDTTQIEALQEGRNEKTTRATQLFSIGVPFNQINEQEELGYEPVEGGDVGYLPMGLLPVGEDRSALLNLSGAEDDSEDDGDKAAEEEPNPKTLTTPNARIAPRLLFQPYSLEHVRAYREWIGKIVPLEQEYARRLRTYLQQVRSFLNLQLDAAMERFESIGEIPRDFFDLSVSFDENLRRISAKHFKRVTLEVAPIVESHINGARIPFVFDPKDPRITEFLKTKEMKVVENVNGRGLREGTRKALVEQQVKGTGFGDLHEALNDVVGDNRRRALTIARTETAQCANGVEFEAEQSAGVTEHMWVATLDDRVRESHVDMMLLGAIPIDSMFPNGCRYPGDVNGPADQVVNCRCTLMAVA